MIRGKIGTRSLNDIANLDDSETSTKLPFRASNIRTSWSLSNLLQNSNGENDDVEEKNSEDQATTKSNDDDKSNRKPKSALERFQSRLHNKVVDLLKQAVKNEKYLDDLFYNISSDVPESVAEKLNLDMERRWYYYELLATYYYARECKEPGFVINTMIGPLCSKLWLQKQFPSIFALLFHRWLVETSDGYEGQGWMMRYNIFLKGTYQLFWFDVRHNTRRIWPIFIRLREHMFASSSPFFPVGNTSRERAASEHHQTTRDARIAIREDFANVLCRFYYFYATRPERVGNFCINQLQLECGLDDFVHELVPQLRQIQKEQVLIRYLKCTATIPLDSLKLSTKNKLYSTLNELILPGAPLYPTDAVSAQAEKTMDTLFPQGKWSRSIINMFFKILRPLYIPHRIMNMLRYLLGQTPAPTSVEND